MGISALLASQILDASATGRSVLTGADASAIRTTLGLGTLATQSPTGTPSASTFLRGDYSWQTIDLSGYVPYSGATGAVNLGANAFTASQATLATGTITASTPAINVSQTWNNAAVSFVGMSIDITKTAATLYSPIFRARQGATSLFEMRADDGVFTCGAVLVSDQGYSRYSFSTNGTNAFRADSCGIGITSIGNGISLGSSRAISWSSTTNWYDTADIFLYRDAAGTLGIRNSTNSQRFNLYGTYTDASNYRRLYLSSTTAGAFTLGVEGAGTGASGNELTINLTSSTQLARIESNGGGINVRCGVGNYAYQFFQNELMPAVSGQLNLGSEQYTRQWGFVYANRFRADGLSLTGSQATSLFDATATWNTTGTPTLLKANVTDTASNAASLLLDLQVGGTSRFKVGKDGHIYGGSTVVGISNSIVLNAASTYTMVYSANVAISDNGSFRNVWIRPSTSGIGEFLLAGGMLLGWSDSNGNAATTTDLVLRRDAADTLAQRRSINAQTFRIYNTFTDSSNYERGKIAWESNVLRIGTEKAGTGSARALELQTDGTTRLTIGTTGVVTATERITAKEFYINGACVLVPSGAGGANIAGSFSSNGDVSLHFANYWLTGGSNTGDVGFARVDADTVRIRARSTDTAKNLQCAAATFSGNVTVSAVNLVTDTTTGTKIGTATTQKIGFWNATPDVQPTTAVAAATLVGGGGTALTDTDTFDGYTIKQVVKALRNLGLLA